MVRSTCLRRVSREERRRAGAKFKIAGANIRNIALSAAFLAAADGQVVKMNHLIQATRREFQKSGRLITLSDFERYFDSVKP